jgi:UDP:flavonoid glycosyltransferase YjiC (YdhE family)
VAAKLEGVKVLTGYSFPVQKAYASNPEYSEGVKESLQQNNLPDIESVLGIFDWADLKIVASSYELEPIKDAKVIHVGPFVALKKPKGTFNQRESILAYMGSGAITSKQLVKTLTEAFAGASSQVYIATKGVKPFKRNNITVDRRFDFSELMPKVAAFINHGGQNSLMAGLVYGIHQIIYPGNVFKRQYNGASVEKLNAGTSLRADDFTSQKIRQVVQEFKANPTYRNNAKKAGEKLLSLGGVFKVIDVLESGFG